MVPSFIRSNPFFVFMYYQYVSSYSFKLLHVLSVTVLNTFVRIGLKMTWSLYRFCDPRAEGKKSLIIFQSLFGMVSPILCKWLIIYYCLCHTTIKGWCHKQRKWAIIAANKPLHRMFFQSVFHVLFCTWWSIEAWGWVYLTTVHIRLMIP